MSLFARTAIAPLEYTKRLWLRSWIAGVAFFLYAPLLVLFIFSFNDSKANVVWKGFTFKYYGKVFQNTSLMEALGNSLTIAALATIFSLVLGALSAVMLWRFRFPFKAGLEGVMSLPIVVPEICMGVAMLVFFAAIKWPNDLPWPFSLGAITIAHITFCPRTPRDLQQGRGGSSQGPGGNRVAGVPRCFIAAYEARPDRRRATVVHAQPR
jgi:spermidine/putrescine transport system permease protein